MCGIVGFLDLARATSDAAARGTLEQMRDCVRHRGPDDAGLWVDAGQGVALGHRRLSIVDLSPEGHQPMRSACGRYVIAFNGEIYNHRALRVELERAGAAPDWRGHSDTEVLLAAVAAWGLTDALRRFNGMFAFALWDVRERTLHLCRDRLGEKPLYYARLGDTMTFGSELKAIRAHPGWRGTIDRGALALYLRHGYVPAPHTIYEGVCKLPPGTTLSLAAGVGGDTAAGPVPYWSARAAAEAGLAAPFTGSPGDAESELDALLIDAVRLRVEADVPLGAFLSGGIDSTTVVAMMQRLASSPVRTFSIGFDAAGHDEAPHARAIAARLGTSHEELYVTPAEALQVIPTLPRLYDEPFADPSQIPTFLVSQLARRHVTVSLSGDGGDELFGGYDRYFIAQSIWRTVRRTPGAVRSIVGAGMRGVPAVAWDTMLKPVRSLLPAPYRVTDFGARVQELGALLQLDHPVSLYRALLSHWNEPERLARNAVEAETALTAPGQWMQGGSFAEQMMYLDQVSYLPDDILVKVDRASMAVGLEARVPFLDHRLVEFAWRLPLHHKMRDGRGKWLLRRVLDRYVPRDVMDRPKRGFVVPLGDWLRGPLREWADALLSPERLRAEGYFDSELVQRRWREHVVGRRNWQYQLWDVLVFQSWLADQAR